MQMFVGGEVTETAMAVGGALLFSGNCLRTNLRFLQTQNQLC